MRATKKADPEIRGGLKNPWVAVDPASLSQQTRDAVKDWQSIHDKHQARREAIFAQRIKEAEERRQQWAIDEKQRKKALAKRLRTLQQVKVLY